MDQNNHIIDINSQLREIVESYKTTDIEKWNKRSIYKLPTSLTQSKETSVYKPHTVSIGPYHHEDTSLKPMEEHKLRAFSCFISRSNKPLESYINALMDPEVVQSLKDSYDELDEYWQRNTQKFVQIMIVDGCFVLEVMRIQTDPTFLKDYKTVDPIFSEHGKLNFVPFIMRDMLKLENQLPLLVLRKLVEVETCKQTANDTIKNLVEKFYFSEEVSVSYQGLHILDLYRQILVGHMFNGDGDKVNNPGTKLADPQSQSNNINTPISAEKVNERHSTVGLDDINIPSAVQLHEAGIKFENSKIKWVIDIAFINGRLKLPVIIVNDMTETTYLNLIAFERLHVGAGNEVTSYVYFMDNIIDNERDVMQLQKEGIIKNMIGSDKAVADLFNTMSKDTMIDQKGRLFMVNKEVNAYCNRRVNQWRASFIHSHLSSPWVMISLIAASLLFVLTLLQTVYAIVGYYNGQ